MRFSLRTLLIVMLIAGPLGAFGWKQWRAYRARVILERTLAIAKLRSAVYWQGGGLASNTKKSPAADEIWNEQRDNISWESFPESQPNSRERAAITK
ncbi:hypothetical protein [Anatilimnocola floriformis]|uniref:hypothetical protein n=1 Tax=Anatilimnocola floriformis TaxID=2948575 RepID=UPI0020C47380|nr:hypothetical protein [Anatilimnocola floriformis]